MVDWSPVVGALGFTALIAVMVIANKVIKYKLELARINAETTIKAEEIRANNQLEIEMLLRQENHGRKSRFQEEANSEETPDRIRRRV
ncbi:hypothetical protein CLHUN_01110 [Ruminiclostridium hungatei]|uniref:Uncharacterized protein n=1 Tax=Ruminiclostridium hungatei TaxID=48256 RepID=A0A1V4SS70_RUMHU|nr:hypothetical protein [Ruminiclostridium hungatei]OPX46295.1 hypothetical protein CLHUN_01110 [Ruminiclostridium hungatei]